MKYAVPLTLVALSSLATAFALVREPSATSSPPLAAIEIEPPWLRGDWREPVASAAPLQGQVLAEGSDPHAGLYAADHANTGLRASDPHAMTACPRDPGSALDPGSGEERSMPEGDPHARTRELPSDVEVPRAVTRSAAANGRTIAEIFAQRATLRDRYVTVRGTVVKRTAGILGKTYLHLRDGSGSAPLENDDLTLTTNEDVQLGELVEVEGQLQVDHDLGIGYRYPALLASATRVAAPAASR